MCNCGKSAVTIVPFPNRTGVPTSSNAVAMIQGTPTTSPADRSQNILSSNALKKEAVAAALNQIKPRPPGALMGPRMLHSTLRKVDTRHGRLNIK